MASLLRTLRNNWKKSLFAAGCVSYGTHYLLKRKRNGNLMQAYCYEALRYGRDKISPEATIRRVTVFLNPIANSERGKFLYDKNSAPILHLSGLDVRLIRLEKNSEANEYMRAIDLNDTDCIVVAGGNATLNEVISGLVNRPDAADFLKRIPIGILPLGETNNFAKKWLSDSDWTSSGEAELRLFADAAMSIVKGATRTADLMKITLTHSLQQTASDEDADRHDNKKRGAYSLLKENKIYALSNVQCGFVTITDANQDNYWYLGFRFLRERMNRYFMDRYLRRNPFRYEFSYKLKCAGCSRCLDEQQLQKQLSDLQSGKTPLPTPATQTAAAAAAAVAAAGTDSASSSLLGRIVRKLGFRLAPAHQSAEQRQQQRLERDKQLRKLSKLAERARRTNVDCDRLFTSHMTQVQLIANINDRTLDVVAATDGAADNDDEDNELTRQEKYIDTVVVKDPFFNVDDMFLASRKSLKEFRLKKLDSPVLDRDKSSVNYFAIQIDGEIYKLNNLPENHLTVHVELLENCIHLLKLDEQLSHSVKANFLPNVYKLSQRTLDRYLFGGKKTSGQAEDTPELLPFEKYYLKYWKPRDTSHISSGNVEQQKEPEKEA